MAILDLGKIRPNWRGDWNTTVEDYAFWDVVRHAGSIWLGLEPKKGIAPGAEGSGWDELLKGLPPLEHKGDLALFDGEKYVRLPLGLPGQNLRAGLAGMPEWGAASARPGTGVAALPKNRGGSVPGKASACLNEQGEVLAWGWGTYYGNGSLSASHTYTPMPVGVSGAQPNGGFTKLYMGMDVLYALDKDGNVWTAGRNNNGQLGHGDTVSRPCLTRVEYFAQHSIRIREVVTPAHWYYTGTDTHSAHSLYVSSYFLGENGLVYVCGYNAEGQLGQNDITVKTLPVVVTGVSNVEQLVVATTSSGAVYARTGEGRLYVWGCNTSGQLGLGDAANRLKATLVTSVQDVAWVAACGDFALCRTSAGRVYGAGTNNYGQLGIGGTTAVNVWTPANVTLPADRIYLCGNSSGGATAYIVDEENQLWVCGSNTAGQLGLGNTANLSSFARVSLDEPWQGKIAKIRCLCTDNDAPAVIILDTAGALWSAGRNTLGQLARGDNAKAAINNRFAKMVHGLRADLRFSDVFIAGYSNSHHVLALASDGRLLSCGYNGWGQLGTHAGNLVTGQDLLCTVRT